MPEYENILELNVDKFSDGYWGWVRYKGEDYHVQGKTWDDFFADVMKKIQSSTPKVKNHE